MGLHEIVFLGIGFVVGAPVGVMLGRRSNRANAYTDAIYARLQAAEDKIAEYRAKAGK